VHQRRRNPLAPPVNVKRGLDANFADVTPAAECRAHATALCNINSACDRS
jgi:hypothetical protein